MTGIVAGGYVTVRVARNCWWTLMVQPVSAPGTEQARRDPSRPRRVTPVLQVSLPAPLMRQVDLACGQWVFLSLDSLRSGIRVMPQHKVDLVEQGPRSRTGTWVTRGKPGRSGRAGCRQRRSPGPVTKEDQHERVDAGAARFGGDVV